MNDRFSLNRFFAIIAKEFIQLRRDRLTFAMVIGIPIMQLVLFGYAINSNPKHLPTAVFLKEQSVFSRSMIYALKNSEYFDIVAEVDSEAEADDLLKRGLVQFIVEIPEEFSRKLLKGERPRVLLMADATDPAATTSAFGAIRELMPKIINRDLKGPNQWLAVSYPAAELVVHAAYNPEGITRYNIVPGLMGVVLTMTMVVITALAMTRERERGTMENLLSTPVKPLEVTLGKIIPYILVGYIQAGLILAVAHFLFKVPMFGNILLLAGVMLVFIAANLAMGITFSTIAGNQLQAVQMAFLFFLPSILLSGFMFPFRGMPVWAQYVGEALPLTHFLRIVRGILLKGNGFSKIYIELGEIMLFAVFSISIGLIRFRKTLD